MTNPTTPERLDSYDAHVVEANAVFRSAGFTLLAMQYPRSAEALIALKRFNGLVNDAKVPFAWNYHPNEWCQRRWTETGRLV